MDNYPQPPAAYGGAIAAPESYPTQNENYANEQDSGLFRPLLDQSRKSKDFMPILPYKDNDPVRTLLLFTNMP
jgi:hypothetical protein